MLAAFRSGFKVVQNVLSEGDDASGGYLVPVEYDSRLLVGRDVFSGEIPLVLWPDYSWKTDKGTYDATNGLFTPAQGASVGEDYIDYVSALVHNKFRFCSSVQSSYYFNTLSKLLK